MGYALHGRNLFRYESPRTRRCRLRSRECNSTTIGTENRIGIWHTPTRRQVITLKRFPRINARFRSRPKFGYLYISLARNYRAQRNSKDAIATLQQALKVDPKNPQVYDELQ